jgi:hypothetical protein
VIPWKLKEICLFVSLCKKILIKDLLILNKDSLLLNIMMKIKDFEKKKTPSLLKSTYEDIGLEYLQRYSLLLLDLEKKKK